MTVAGPGLVNGIEGPRSSTIGARIEAPKALRGYRRYPSVLSPSRKKIEFRSQIKCSTSGAFWALFQVQLAAFSSVQFNMLMQYVCFIVPDEVQLCAAAKSNSLSWFLYRQPTTVESCRGF